MVLRIVHIDDSAIALRAAADVLRRVSNDVEIHSFRSAAEFLVAAQGGSLAKPQLCLVDLNMPGISGLELLNWLKRHPGYHDVATVVLSAELEDESRRKAMLWGAFDYLPKPLTEEVLAGLIDRLLQTEEARQVSTGLRASFAEELFDLTQELYRVAQPVNYSTGGFSDDSNSVTAALFRIFHTIKGGASVLQLPILADFVHQVESTLVAIQKGRMWGIPHVQSSIRQVFELLERHAEALTSGTLLEAVPSELTEGLELIRKNVAAGWVDTRSFGTPAPVSMPMQESAKEAGVVGRTRSSVRVLNTKLDHLQSQFKRVLQLRTKLSSFSNQLKQEFFDEAFPNELAKLVADLGQETTAIMDFFISLRVEPVKRLRGHCERVIEQTAEKLGRPAGLRFESEEGLEADLPILECLEQALTHLLRNAIDHGFESPEGRRAAKKPELPEIRVSLSREGQDSVAIRVIDDGRGIDPTELRRIALVKQLVDPQILRHFSDEQVLELIFVDGVSTRSEVTETSGRGAGMAAVKESIEKLDGKIQVTSVPGKGTEFAIRLPRIFKL